MHMMIMFVDTRMVVGALQAAELVAFIALSVLLTVRIITDEILIQNENTLGITFAVATVIFNGVYLILFLKTYTDLKRKRFLSIGPVSIGYSCYLHLRRKLSHLVDALCCRIPALPICFDGTSGSFP